MVDHVIQYSLPGYYSKSVPQTIKHLTYFFIRRHFRIGVTPRLQKWWKSSSSKADPNDKTGLVNLYRGLIN